MNPKDTKSTIRRTQINLDELRINTPSLATKLVQTPLTTIPELEHEHNSLLSFTGSLGVVHTPRTLNTPILNTLVVVEGIVSCVKVKQPKIRKSVYEKDGVFYEKDYRDAVELSRFGPTSTVIPNKMEYGMSEFVDFQSFSIQEDLEDSRPGHVPCSVDAVVVDDLAGSVRPGEKVRVYGVYRSIGNLAQGYPSRFSTVLIVFSIERNEMIFSSAEFKNNNLNENQTETAIKPIPIDILISLFCKSIYGHSEIKLAILLQIVGGNEMKYDCMRIRGDINILMVGDPGTGKSQLLRFVPNVTRAKIVTGRGCTQAGLTAAVVDGTVEPGAMVLCSGGICCIDEFDKIGEDILILHEVMEQQTISISKGGVHCTLDAKCGVLAAANPAMGQYDESKSVSENINVIDTLLSRFDLVFIVKDSIRADAEIAQHVLGNLVGDSEQKSDVLFNYISAAKRIRPKMSEEARLTIVKEYVRLRATKTDRLITPRVLESFIRISTAHAKLRLSQTIEVEDVEVAIKLFKNEPNRGDTKRMKVGLAEQLILLRDAGKQSVTFIEIMEIVGGSEDVVRKELEEMHRIDVIMFYDENIYFI